MSVAAETSHVAPLLSWAQICETHWDEWVCLIDVVDAADGSVQTARILGHNRSAIMLVRQVERAFS